MKTSLAPPNAEALGYCQASLRDGLSAIGNFGDKFLTYHPNHDLKKPARHLGFLVLLLALSLGLRPSSHAQCCPPVITNQPQSQIVVAGSTVSFVVGATSQTFPTYQWRFNNTNIPGATSTNYVIVNAQPTNNGLYSVAITNQAGWAISSNASLTVLATGTVQFASSSFLVSESGDHATILVRRTGTPTGPASVNYNTFNGTASDGIDYQSTSGVLSWSDGDTADKFFNVPIFNNSLAGGSTYFTAALSGAVGVLLGDPASTTITIIQPPLITSQPQSLAVTQGDPASFQVTADAAGPASYQWQFNGTVLPAPNAPSLGWLNTQAAQAGLYTVVVSNIGGTVISSNALLTVTVPPGTVVGWGDNSLLQTTTPAGLGTVRAIAGGGNFSLALRSDGTVAGWGDNGFGQTIPPSGLNDAIAIAGGGYHSLALRANGTVLGWGYNNNGQAIGTPSTNSPYTASGPVFLSGLLLAHVVSVSAGYVHSLALKDDGTVVAWGDNGSGESSVPSKLNSVVSIAAGSYFSLALKSDGTVSAWGASSAGVTNVPAGLGNVVAIAAGGNHCLALQTDGTVVAWGLNSSGQTNVPPFLANVVEIAVGSAHSLAVTADGSVFVWGDNSLSQALVPAGLANVAAIGAGANHSLALQSDGSVVLTVQPFNQRVYQHAGASFTALAEGNGPLTYQWRYGSLDITDATNATYTIPDALPTNSGLYSVTVSNSFGPVASSNATLSILYPAVLLTSPSKASNGFLFFADVKAPGSSNLSAVLDIQASTNALDWFLLDSLAFSFSGENIVPYTDVNASSFSRRFYRTFLR